MTLEPDWLALAKAGDLSDAALREHERELHWDELAANSERAYRRLQECIKHLGDALSRLEGDELNPPPQLCEQCLALLHASIREKPAQTLNLTYCRHFLTLAHVRVEGGRITKWRLSSPVTSQQVASLIAGTEAVDARFTRPQ